MTRSQATLLACRFAALYLGIHAVETAVTAGSILLIDTDRHELTLASVLGWFASSVLFALLGAVLFLAAPAIARRAAGPGAGPLVERWDYLAIGLSVGAVLLWTAAIQDVGQVVFQWRSGFVDLDRSPLAGAAGSAVLLAVLGAMLFLRADPISRRIARAPAASSSVPAHLQAVAFSVLGLWLLASAIPDLAVLAANWAEPAGWSDPASAVDPEAGLLGRSWIVPAARAALGAGLFLGGDGLSRIWHGLRGFGLQPRPGA